MVRSVNTRRAFYLNAAPLGDPASWHRTVMPGLPKLAALSARKNDHHDSADSLNFAELWDDKDGNNSPDRSGRAILLQGISRHETCSSGGRDGHAHRFQHGLLLVRPIVLLSSHLPGRLRQWLRQHKLRQLWTWRLRSWRLRTPGMRPGWLPGKATGGQRFAICGPANGRRDLSVLHESWSARLPGPSADEHRTVSGSETSKQLAPVGLNVRRASSCARC
jgi:hypothetical protein